MVRLKHVLTWTAAVLVMFTAANAEAAGYFGTRCQDSYEGGWQTKLSYMNRRCAWFNDELDDTDRKVFYYNMKGGSGFTYNDTYASAGGVDAVDLFYVGTHGGAWSSDAVLTLWNRYQDAKSSQWRFNDAGRGVEIFSQYACETLKHDGMFKRWEKAFRGGLKIATGSHRYFWDGSTTDETGEDYADGLQKRKTIKKAWFDGNSDWKVTQDMTVVASGRTSSECFSRVNNMTWQNIGSYAALRDNDVKWLCWYSLRD